MPYDSLIARAGSGSDPFVPEPVATEIIQSLPAESAVLRLARRVTMSSKTSRMPVLSALPTAYFVTGDTGLKQTTEQAWENLDLVAEELAVIVPIPISYMADSGVPLWNEVRPRITAAMGAAIDAATLFGVNKPGTWGAALVPTAVTAGNVVTEGTGDDIAVDVANVAREVVVDGFNVTGFATEAGFRWRLIGLRSQDGIPIYAPPAGDQPGTLFGFPVQETNSGAWDRDEASLVAGDWSQAILGVRQDITFEIFREGVIQDNTGAIVLNLMQQDSVALRAVMRVAWAVANPITDLNTDGNTRYPFAVLAPAGS